MGQEDIGAAAMLGFLEEITLEAGLTRKVAGDVAELNLPDRSNEDMSILHWIDATDLHSRAMPHPDAASYPTFANSFP